jgi:hypothetical protein
VNTSKQKVNLTWDGQDITCKLIQIGKQSLTAQPPLNWVASVEILLGELPELKKFIDWYTRFLKPSHGILLWGAVES